MASTEQVEQSLKDLNEAVSCGMDNAEPERAFESICFADVALNKLISNGVIQVPPEDELNYVNFQRFPTLDAKKLVNAPKMSAHHRGICHF